MAEGTVNAKAPSQKHDECALEIAGGQYVWNGGITMLNPALRRDFHPFCCVPSSWFQIGVFSLTLESPHTFHFIV